MALPLAERKGSTLRLDPSTPCVAEIDSRRIERVLRNLVVNAIEHGEGRDISVRSARTTKWPWPYATTGLGCGLGDSPGFQPLLACGPRSGSDHRGRGSGWRSPSRTRGCTAAGCRRGVIPATGRSFDSLCPDMPGPI